MALLLCRFHESLPPLELKRLPPIIEGAAGGTGSSCLRMEDALERCVADDVEAVVDRPPVVYAARRELGWLGATHRPRSALLPPPSSRGNGRGGDCEDGRAEKKERSPPLQTLTGLLEDFGGGEPDVPIDLAVWRAEAVVVAGRSSRRGGRSNRPVSGAQCRCRAPKLAGARRPLPAEDDAAAAAVPTSGQPPLKVHWVDLRECSAAGNDGDGLPLPTAAAATHFLRSLLGTDHAASPWRRRGGAASETCGGGGEGGGNGRAPPGATTDAQCVLVAFGGRAPEALANYRVGDACPSWYLYSTFVMKGERGPSWLLSSSQGLSEVAVYRRLPPRPLFSVRHPLSAAETPFPGCLWETYFPEPHHDEQETDNGEDVANYRVAAPPYLDFSSEFRGTAGCRLRELLRPENVAVLRREAATIQHWTAWPESVHYAKSQSTGQAPWHVFPLCYCFPADDLSNRRWIDATCSHVPNTVSMLRQYAGDALRTALFSRLEPDSVLEAHTGWQDLANHVVRVHVPVRLPAGDLCGTWVDGCVETHAEDKLLAFDDSKTHRAFNYSDEPRIVLIVDMERPATLPPGTAVGGHSEELDAFINQFPSTKG